MQKKIDTLKLNQEIIDIIYQYTPYKKYNLFFFMWCIFSFAIGIGILISLDINIKSSMISFVWAAFAFIGCLPYVLIVPFGTAILDSIDEIDEKQFDLNKLDKAIEKIRKRGLYSQFITDPLFNPITNPDSVITYADIYKIIKEQNIMANKITEKISITDKNIKDSKIFNQQKSIVNKYRVK